MTMPEIRRATISIRDNDPNRWAKLDDLVHDLNKLIAPQLVTKS